MFMNRSHPLDSPIAPCHGLLRSLRGRLAGWPWTGLALLVSAGLIGLLMFGLPDDDHGARMQQGQNGCAVNVAGKRTELPIGKSVIDQGRTIACRNYDGHIVLVYTAQN